MICGKGILAATISGNFFNGIFVNIYVCSLEGINGLFWVSDNDNYMIRIFHKNCFENIPLLLIGVLKLIDDCVSVFLLQLLFEH